MTKQDLEKLNGSLSIIDTNERLIHVLSKTSISSVTINTIFPEYDLKVNMSDGYPSENSYELGPEVILKFKEAIAEVVVKLQSAVDFHKERLERATL